MKKKKELRFCEPSPLCSRLFGQAHWHEPIVELSLKKLSIIFFEMANIIVQHKTREWGYGVDPKRGLLVVVGGVDARKPNERFPLEALLGFH